MLGVLDPGAARALAVPARRLPQARRARARPTRRGLLVADKPDSHDICFVADGDNAGWLREKLGDRAPNRGGDIVDDATGEVLGSHEGTYGFTIGQRKGLRIGRARARRQAALRARHRAGLRHRHGRPARAAGRRPDRAAIRPRWCGTVPTAPGGHRPAARPRRRAPGRRCDDRRRARSRSSCSTRRTASRRARPRSSTTAPAWSARPRSPPPRSRRHRMSRRHRRRVDAGPGDDAARRTPRRCGSVLGELPDLPHLPELPGRGAAATMTGRGARGGRRARRRPAAGRLAAHRRRRASTTAGPASLLAQDLDAVEEQAQGVRRAFKVQVAGPWTLAATVEKPRGDKVLSDHGARRDLAQALAEGLRDARRRRTPPGARRGAAGRPGRRAGAARGAGAARCPTASGFGRHRTVAPARGLARRWPGCWPRSPTPEPSRGCTAARRRRRSTCSAAPVPGGSSVDLDAARRGDHDAARPRRSRPGRRSALGVVPSTEPDAAA